MIEVTQDIAIDESEIELDYIRASGPGGQNVNKVATAVQLRWEVFFNLFNYIDRTDQEFFRLDQAVKERLGQIAGF